MISRKEIADELVLRESIRKLLKQKILKEQKQEKELRGIIRKLILQEAEASSPGSPYDITAMNFLKTLLQNILPKIESSYKSLTSSDSQRKSFRAHILNGADELLQTLDVGPEDVEEKELEEEINIDIDSTPEGFIDIEDPKEKEEPEEEPAKPEDLFGKTLSDTGLDLTGRNLAYKTFKEISPQIEKTYTGIDSNSIVPANKVPEMGSDTPERDVFRAYLIKNLQLYFDKFEEELSPSPEEPVSGV
jgi:hypothetical protein